MCPTCRAPAIAEAAVGCGHIHLFFHIGLDYEAAKQLFMLQILATPFTAQFWKDLWSLFLGEKTPTGEPVPWQIKAGVIAALLLNVVVSQMFGVFWTIVLVFAEFIGCLALASFVYPLLTGGLLFVQVLALHWLPYDAYVKEVNHSMKLTLLLIFVVTGVDFLQGIIKKGFQALVLSDTRLTNIYLAITAATATLSAFLDALTVTAALMLVMSAFMVAQAVLQKRNQITQEQAGAFTKFLLGLMFGGLIGTMLGGMQTMIGEPQNYDIANRNNWDMVEFFLRMAPIGIPVLITGFFAIHWVVKNKKYGYGAPKPAWVESDLVPYLAKIEKEKTSKDRAILFVQFLLGIWFVYSLFAHTFDLWVYGLMLIILVASFTGINKEHDVAKRFVEALGFVAILMTFYAMIAAIGHWNIFDSIIDIILSFESERVRALFIAISSGLKSILSDNVMVEVLWMNELDALLKAKTISPWEHDYYSIALNAGTNVPSILTPNGSAPFLFFYVSGLAIRLFQVKFMDMVHAAWPVFVPCVAVMIMTVLFYPELFQLVEQFVPESLPYSEATPSGEHH